jgi:hypothetical protein
MRGKLGLFARVPPPFDVTSISGLAGWWDASDSATLFNDTTGGSAVAADGAVARLEDKSGVGYHWSQSDSSLRPARKTGIRNSLDVLRFDGVDDFLFSDAPDQSQSFFPSDLFFSTTAHTAFAVVKVNSASTNNASPAYNASVMSVGGAGGYSFFSMRSSNKVQSGIYDANSFPFGGREANYTIGTWAVMSSRNSVSQNSMAVFVNGVSGASGNGVTSQGSVFWSPPYMGARWDGSNSLAGTLSFDFGELITFNVALSASDRQAVESYLMTKWAIT